MDHYRHYKNHTDYRKRCRVKQAHRLYHAIGEECPCLRAAHVEDWDVIYSDERRLATINAMVLKSRT